MCVIVRLTIILITKVLNYLGLPQHATLAPATYYTSPHDDNGSQSPTKYHENGHDTFSDFVTLVCQEAQSTQVIDYSVSNVLDLSFHTNEISYNSMHTENPVWQKF